MMMELPFDSAEAKIVNRKIFETIYFGALESSMNLAKINGPYQNFKGSPLSKGKFQWNLWKKDKSYLLMDWDWNTLRSDIMKHGVRNSLLTTIMPTASTSQIMGFSECIEPHTTNIYTRSTMAGKFVVINKYLIEKLIELGLWNDNIKNELIYDDGSVTNIESIPDNIKQKVRTSHELKMRALIDQSIERRPFIDQSQSLNLYCKIPNPKHIYLAHMYGWEDGLKTGMYYLRSQPASSPIKFGIDVVIVKEIENKRKLKQIQKQLE